MPTEAGAMEWWDLVGALGPISVLMAALISGALAWRALAERRIADHAALEQRREADARSQWWARTQWALDASMSDLGERQEIGLGILDLLAKSRLAGDEETEIISVAWSEPLEGPIPDMDAGGDPGDND